MEINLINLLIYYIAFGLVVFLLDCFAEGIRLRDRIRLSSYMIIFTWPFELSFSFGMILGIAFNNIKKKSKKKEIFGEDQLKKFREMEKFDKTNKSNKTNKTNQEGKQ